MGNRVIKYLLYTLIAIIFFTLSSRGQAKIVIGEYQQGYITSAGKVYTPVITGYDYQVTMSLVSGLNGIVDGDGAQYTTIYYDSLGRTYVLQGQSTSVTQHFLKTDNSPINASFVNGLYKSYFCIDNGEVYYLPASEDEMNYNGGATNSKWIKLTQPTGGRTVIKITSGKFVGVDSGIMMALCSDGTVWEYSRGNSTPTQLSFTGTAVDIAQVSQNAEVIITAANKIFVRGYWAEYVEGGVNFSQSGSFTDVTTNWTSKGVTFPLKITKGTHNSLHIIDANNNLFASGGNMEGMIGNGVQYPSWRTYWYAGVRQPYRWSFQNGDMNTGVTQIIGKFKNIVTHNAVTFYLYAQDMGGNWYSWGRNKANSLGNGTRMKGDDEGNYADYLNIPAPRKVTPLTTPYVYIGDVDTTALRTPIANAGVDQYLSGVTSTTLYGSGSHQQQPGQTTTVTMTNNWTQISGKAATITNPTSVNTTVTGLEPGTYAFRNTVTSSHGSDYQDVMINIVGSDPQPPATGCNNCIITNLIIRN